MLKKILLLFALLPICFVIDQLNSSNWTESYIGFLKLYWDVIIVLFCSYYLYQKNKGYQYSVSEGIRESQFFSEVRRYNGTPYIPPLLLLYLKNPPGSIYPSDYEYVNDTFYRTVVNVFRDRIYILQEITAIEPAERSSYLLDIVGPKRLGILAFYVIAPFLWYYLVTQGLGLSLLNDWPLLTLPLICLSFRRAVSLMKGILTYLPHRLTADLSENNCEMKVTWRDAFPDREIGRTFIKAYYFELEKRQRYELTIQGKKVPNKYPVWNNGNFAPYLYPSEEIPVWESEYQPYLDKKLAEQRVIEVEQNAKVVHFPQGAK